MNLRIVREHYTPDCTVGRLYIDDMFECDTIARRSCTAGSAIRRSLRSRYVGHFTRHVMIKRLTR
jgi:hypothetical protein